MSDYAEAAATATENYEAEPAVEPAPVEAGAAAAPTPSTVQDDAGDVPSSGEGAAPTWTGVTQDEWTALQQRQAELEQQLQQQPRFDPYTGQPLQEGQAKPEIPEPWDPEFAQKLEAYHDWRDQQREDAYRPFVETAMNDQASVAMTEALTALKGEVEGFTDDHFKAAELVGNGFLGETGGDPYAALRKGAEYVTGMLKSERDAAVTAYKESLQRGNGQAEPGATGAGIASPGLPGSYSEIAETFIADPGRSASAW